MANDRIVLIDTVMEDYHTCLKCVDSEGSIDRTTLWQVYIDGNPLPDENAVANHNGTLILLFPTVVIPSEGRDVDVIANCYTPDQSLNRNISLYSQSMSPNLISCVSVFQCGADVMW